MARSAFASRAIGVLAIFCVDSGATAQDVQPVPEVNAVTAVPAPALPAVRTPAIEPRTLPAVPPAPTATLPEYPNCRDEYRALSGRIAQANLIRACITRLDRYNQDILQAYRARMYRYREQLSQLWNEVNGSADYSRTQKRAFYDQISAEFENSREDGAYLEQYRSLFGRYQSDRDFLRLQFCSVVTCQ